MTVVIADSSPLNYLTLSDRWEYAPAVRRRCRAETGNLAEMIDPVALRAVRAMGVQSP